MLAPCSRCLTDSRRTAGSAAAGITERYGRSGHRDRAGGSDAAGGRLRPAAVCCRAGAESLLPAPAADHRSPPPSPLAGGPRRDGRRTALLGVGRRSPGPVPGPAAAGHEPDLPPAPCPPPLPPPPPATPDPP